MRPRGYSSPAEPTGSLPVVPAGPAPGAFPGPAAAATPATTVYVIRDDQYDCDHTSAYTGEALALEHARVLVTADQAEGYLRTDMEAEEIDEIVATYVVAVTLRAALAERGVLYERYSTVEDDGSGIRERLRIAKDIFLRADTPAVHTVYSAAYQLGYAHGASVWVRGTDETAVEEAYQAGLADLRRRLERGDDGGPGDG